MGNFKKFITLQTIGSKIILSAIIGVLAFSTITQAVVSNTIKESEIASVKEKERSDIAYMEDYLSPGDWNVQNYMLCKGDVLIGDGTTINANIEPFKYLEEMTGSFFYSFLRIDHLHPTLLSAIQLKEGSSYLRVAGSTTDPNGNSIVGTFMEANVSSVLDQKGEYSDFATVEGGVFYCLYRTLVDSSGQTIGAIVVGRSIDQLNKKITDANLRIVIFIAIGFALMVAALSVVIVRWVRSIRKSQNYLKKIGHGEFPSEPLVITSKDEMHEMAEIINHMNISLKEKERLSTELSLATDIQVSMLPTNFDDIHKTGYFDIFASMDPAREVGGDFYDFFMVDDKNIAFVIADVSGKGIPAALLMAIAKTVIRNFILSGSTPAEAFIKANNIFSENNEAGLFITAWLGVLNAETGLLTYVNAGHNPPLMYSKEKGFEFIKSKAGFVLGGLEGIKFKENTLTFSLGDRLFLYTDGVTEAHNKNNALYGEFRLVKYLNSNTALNIGDLAKGLINDISKFVNGAEQSDDITMLTLEFTNRKEVYGISQTFKAERENLDDCINFVNGELEKADCTPKALNQIDLVVEEIFVNIADHGYKSSKGDVEITVDVKDDIATIIFKDRGAPFNPLTRQDPNLSLSAEERNVGGLGIFLAKKIMDSIEYEFKNNQNILTTRKKIK